LLYSSISCILKLFHVFSKYFVSFVSFLKYFVYFVSFWKYFVYCQIISCILNLPAFHSHPNTSPSIVPLSSFLHLPQHTLTRRHKAVTCQLASESTSNTKNHNVNIVFRISCISFISESISWISRVFRVFR
jgi:hypothetical protein